MSFSADISGGWDEGRCMKVDRELVIGGFYRHFKNKLYQVKGIAYHSETKEKMVVYQAMYGEYSLYVRPFDMFMSEVDHRKYPDVSQKYRFEQVDPANWDMNSLIGKNIDANFLVHKDVTVESQHRHTDGDTDNDVDTESGSDSVDSHLMTFLDLSTYQEKLKYIDTIKDKLDDQMIDAMAASLDTEVPAGSVSERYQSLRQVIAAHAKYECTRLRGN